MAKAPQTLSGTPEQQQDFVIHCWNGNKDAVIDTLIQHPDAVHWRHPESHNTGLTYVAAHGSHKYDIATLLLDNGADIDAQNKKGETALILAVKCGSEAFVELFLSRGADPDIRDLQGKMAEEYAQDSGRLSVADEFEKHRTRSKRDAEAAVRYETEQKEKALREDIAQICEGTRQEITLNPLPAVKRRPPRP